MEQVMPEAVIVSTARSPIGRAYKGSLKELRGDDLVASIIRAALEKVPELDPAEIEDIMIGCGLPGGETGFNIGPVAAALLGLDSLPGTTITRYCASSLQTTRMAMHAILAGEGDVYVSAGVETVSRFTKGSSDSLPHARTPASGVPVNGPPQPRREWRTDGPIRGRSASCPTSTSRWARPPKTSPTFAV
jgi:acetyl-CoA C-acetyltransferase